MKKRVFTIVTALFLVAGSLVAQTLTDVINEFNAGVASLNGQAYQAALTQFNSCLELCDQVGIEADDMKNQSKEQIVGTHYRQATTLMSRKQYDKAIPHLENTVATSLEYEAKPEYAAKANKYLPSLYLREGKVLLNQDKYEESIASFDKALDMKPTLYKAHQGKGLVYKEQGEVDQMLEEFAIGKAKAIEKGDQEVITDINSAIDGYYRVLLLEELEMIDTEDPDYTYLLEICDQALDANPKNGFAAWQAGSAKNKMVEYDDAIAYIEPVVESQTDSNLLSALYYELGIGYQNSVRYAEACEAYNKVTEEPFFTKAEKKMMTTPDCN